MCACVCACVRVCVNRYTILFACIDHSVCIVGCMNDDRSEERLCALVREQDNAENAPVTKDCES